MKKYSVEGQNVYEEQNPLFGKTLYCIAITQDIAIEIAATLNVINNHLPKKETDVSPHKN